MNKKNHKKKFSVTVSRTVVQELTFDIEVDTEGVGTDAHLHALLDLEAVFQAPNHDFSGREKTAQYKLERWGRK